MSNSGTSYSFLAQLDVALVAYIIYTTNNQFKSKKLFLNFKNQEKLFLLIVKLIRLSADCLPSARTKFYPD